MTLYVIQSNVVRLDARVYGDDGHLPGVAIDKRNWFDFFSKLGAQIKGYLNPTKKEFSDAIKSMALIAKSGDTVVIQHSGHGTQKPDTSGDEADGMDEVLCLYDGTIIDDVVWSYLQVFKRGVKVVLITDTCHAGSSFRSMSLIAERISSGITEENEDLNCSLVAIATSSDSQTSADTSKGGAGSNALLATWGAADDYRDWVIKAQKWLKRNRFRQDMVLNQVNASSLVKEPPLSVVTSDALAEKHVSGITVYFNDGTSEYIG